jgi:hypothetical protein
MVTKSIQRREGEMHCEVGITTAVKVAVFPLLVFSQVWLGETRPATRSDRASLLVPKGLY